MTEILKPDVKLDQLKKVFCSYKFIIAWQISLNTVPNREFTAYN